MSMSSSLVNKYKGRGYKPNLPLIIVPGLCSSMLYAEESPYEPWVGKRIWINLDAIGLGKVWDFNVPLFNRKRKDDPELTGPDENVTNNVDLNLKRRWIQHVIMNKDDLVSDPPGIKLRAVKGLYGCAYLDPGPLTKSASYVFGPFIETLQALGYTDDNLRAATYDWRVPPKFTESRDGYLTELKNMILDMYRADKKKVVLLGHSLGSKMVCYFLRWVEDQLGRKWISDHIETFLAVGPLFLGAPKSIRGCVTGERMGLDPLLYPNEGVALSRGCGSGPWMFPVKTADFEMMQFSHIRTAKGVYEPRKLQDIIKEGDVDMAWEVYEEHYLGDPFFGPDEEQIKPPPVDKIYAIYGVNLETEMCYFFRKAKSAKPLTTLELDPDGSIPNYKCKGGIGYETSKTKQNFLRGKMKSGDGTVPYASLAYCLRWANKIDVRVDELNECDHRAILADKRFTRAVIEYICKAPPTYELPDCFADLEYEGSYVLNSRSVKCNIILTRKAVELHRSRGKKSVAYRDLENVTKSDTDDTTFYLLEAGTTNPRVITSSFRQELVGEIVVRCRLIDRLASGETIEDEERDEQGQTALHRAASAGDTAKVTELIQKGIDVNSMDRNGSTALHMAAQDGNFDIIECLLQAPDINVNQVNKDGTSALHYLIRQNPTDPKQQAQFDGVLRMVKERGANLNLKGKSGESALHQAVRRGGSSAISWLLKNNANVNSRTDFGETPLHYAIRSVNIDVTKQLIAAGADKHVQAQDGTPFALARKVDPNIFAVLCDADGMSTSRRSTVTTGVIPTDEYGQTELHKAAFDNNVEGLFLCMQTNAAMVNAQDRNGWTPLHSAASQGHIDALLLLLTQSKSHAPDPTLVTSTQTSVIHYLVKHTPENDIESKKMEQALNKLADLGCDMQFVMRTLGTQAKDQFGDTPIHRAVFRGNTAATKWLLQREDVNVNAKNQHGDTPLHYAIRGQNKSMISLLLEHGADVNAQSTQDGTPRDLAKKMKSPEIDALLTKYGGSETANRQVRKLKSSANLRQSFYVSSDKAGSWEQIADSLNKDYVEEEEDEEEDDDEEISPQLPAPVSDRASRPQPSRPPRKNASMQGTVMFERKKGPAPPSKSLNDVRARHRPPPSSPSGLRMRSAPGTPTKTAAPGTPTKPAAPTRAAPLPGRGGRGRPPLGSPNRPAPARPGPPPRSFTPANAGNNVQQHRKIDMGAGRVSRGPPAPRSGGLRADAAGPQKAKSTESMTLLQQRPTSGVSTSSSVPVTRPARPVSQGLNALPQVTSAANKWKENKGQLAQQGYSGTSSDGRITAEVSKEGKLTIVGFPLDPAILEAASAAYENKEKKRKDVLRECVSAVLDEKLRSQLLVLLDLDR